MTGKSLKEPQHGGRKLTEDTADKRAVPPGGKPAQGDSVDLDGQIDGWLSRENVLSLMQRISSMSTEKQLWPRIANSC